MMTFSSRFFLILCTLLCPTAFAATATMRLDYFHTGNAKQELFSVDEVVIEPLPWAGNPDRPIDDVPRGKYLFEVIDPVSNKVTYSRSFSSIYGEWEQTAEAAKLSRTFEESLRFPAPKGKVRIILKKRRYNAGFSEIWRTEVDPDDMLVNTAKPSIPADVFAVMKNGTRPIKSIC